MDVLFMFMGALCLTEGIDLFTGNDFLMFVGSAKKEDYDLKKVSQVERWIFPADATRSFGVGFNRFPDGVETILLVVFRVTLVAHVYVSKSKKLRKERQRGNDADRRSQWLEAALFSVGDDRYSKCAQRG